MYHFYIATLFIAGSACARQTCRSDQSCVASCPQIEEIRAELASIQSQVIRDTLRDVVESSACGRGRYCCDGKVEGGGGDDDDGCDPLTEELNNSPVGEICGVERRPDGPRLALPTSPQDFEDAAGTWPWMASYGYEDDSTGDWEHKCGATLVSRRHLLTAAHCRDADKELLWMRTGDTDLKDSFDDDDMQVVKVERFVSHPQYRSGRAYFDVAVVTLERPVNFNSYTVPVCLPTKPSEASKLSGLFVTLTGWGLQARNALNGYDYLKRTTISVFSQRYCNITYADPGLRLKEDAERLVPRLFQSDVVCAGYEAARVGSCLGDSGGPLVRYVTDGESGKLHYVQEGVVSSGVGACGDFPGIYARVADRSVLTFVYKQADLFRDYGIWSTASHDAAPDYDALSDSGSVRLPPSADEHVEIATDVVYHPRIKFGRRRLDGSKLVIERMDLARPEEGTAEVENPTPPGSLASSVDAAAASPAGFFAVVYSDLNDAEWGYVREAEVYRQRLTVFSSGAAPEDAFAAGGMRHLGEAELPFWDGINMAGMDRRPGDDGLLLVLASRYSTKLLVVRIDDSEKGPVKLVKRSETPFTIEGMRVRDGIITVASQGLLARFDAGDDDLPKISEVAVAGHGRITAFAPVDGSDDDFWVATDSRALLKVSLASGLVLEVYEGASMGPVNRLLSLDGGKFLAVDQDIDRRSTYASSRQEYHDCRLVSLVDVERDLDPDSEVQTAKAVLGTRDGHWAAPYKQAARPLAVPAADGKGDWLILFIRAVSREDFEMSAKRAVDLYRDGKPMATNATQEEDLNYNAKYELVTCRFSRTDGYRDLAQFG